MVGAVGKAIGNVVSGIKKKITGLLGIHSPSRWMRDMIGKNMMLGWTKGIDAQKSATLKKAQQMTDWMKPDIPVVSGFVNRLKAVGTPVKGLVPNVAIAGDNPIVNSRRTYEQALKAPEYAIVNIDGRQVMKATMDYYIDEQKRRDAIRDRFRG
jgi:phage-related protein